MCVRAEGQRADVAAVLHDLRGPLLTVRSYLDMLAEGGFGALPSEAREAAERAGVAAARAQALAEALVGGSMAVRRVERVELSELLDEVFMALGAEITAAGASVEADTLPAVTRDRQAFYRVFANLVENAVKYSGTGSPRVVVSASSDGEHARIAVRDWGVGSRRQSGGWSSSRGCEAPPPWGAAGRAWGSRRYAHSSVPRVVRRRSRPT